jgi:hypothetical protein
VNTKSPYISTSFGGENTGEVNKANICFHCHNWRGSAVRGRERLAPEAGMRSTEIGQNKTHSGAVRHEKVSH